MHIKKIRADLYNVTLEDIKHAAADYVADNENAVCVYAMEWTDIYEVDVYKFYPLSAGADCPMETWFVAFDDYTESLLDRVAFEILISGKPGAEPYLYKN